MSVRDMCTGDAATVPAELRGYRMWRVRSGCLTATNAFNGEWMSAELTAECRVGAGSGREPSHPAPNERCGCGIYAWYRPDETRIHRGDVFGVVAASGRALLGDYGFRAERARVVALVVPRVHVHPREHLTDSMRYALGHDDHRLERWCARYDVKVFQTREALVEAFPPDDVRELLGREIPPDLPVPSIVGLIPVPSMAAQMTEFQKAMQHLAATTQADANQLARAFTDLIAATRRRAPRRPFLSPAIDAAAPTTRAAMMAALEAKRTGERGPEKRRRGRARLSL